MSVTDNTSNEQLININKSEYVLPAVIRRDNNEIPFEKALIVSILLHIITFVLILLTSWICQLLGINFDMMKKPDMTKDIEFVLVEKEADPIDKNTKNRADINSRAGGKHDPSKQVSLPQESAPKSPAKKPTPPVPAQKQPEKPKVKPQPVTQPKQQTKPAQQPAPQQPVQQPAPKTEAPKPQAPKPALTKPSATSAPKPNPSSDFNIPIPKSNLPSVAPATTAPVTSSSSGTPGSSGSGKASSAAPSFSPATASSGSSKGTGTTQGGGGRFSNGTGSNSSSNAGNPGPGNPSGAPGIDAVKEPDFGPYMKDLQRRIKMNWDPPKGDQSKRVILLFTIAKDGRLLNISVHKSSGLPDADNAAIQAVKLTAPFKPLPADFRGKSVDIQFTFDYNVFGISG